MGEIASAANVNSLTHMVCKAPIAALTGRQWLGRYSPMHSGQARTPGVTGDLHCPNAACQHSLASFASGIAVNQVVAWPAYQTVLAIYATTKVAVVLPALHSMHVHEEQCMVSLV